MAFDLTIGTERAQALQNSIQDELTKRGYSQDADPVMAEYITIMLINNKTPEQITTELIDLIGVNEFDPSFTEWLFAEAAKKSENRPEPPAPVPEAPKNVTAPSEAAAKAPSGPRITGAALYNHALSQALPSAPQQSQKRTASARSPSPVPGQTQKTRRTDVPTGPKAMHGRDGGQRSLLDRMGGRPRTGMGGGMRGRDEIQARIDAVTNQMSEGPMMNGGFNGGMGGMMVPSPEMQSMNPGMVNPLALQEMMMNQMALMAQMASTMGMLPSPGQGQFVPPNGYQMMNGVNAGRPEGQVQSLGARRGGAPAGRGRGRGGTSAQWVAPHLAESTSGQTPSSVAPTTVPSPTPSAAMASAPVSVVASSPKPAMPSAATEAAASSLRPGFTPPERPQSPSLCKFGLSCTNALCRYSHPSPVATPESGIVLSNDPCEAGINCTDKDCIKAHVSPAAVGVPSVPVVSRPAPTPAPAPAQTNPMSKVLCRYGAGCLRINSGCPYSHPHIPKVLTGQHNVQCRFGAACTRATCLYQHPPGRVLPGTFHRGLAENAPIVNVPTPESGSMNQPSPHRTVVFNKPGVAAGSSGARASNGESGEKKGMPEVGSGAGVASNSNSNVVQATA